MRYVRKMMTLKVATALGVILAATVVVSSCDIYQDLYPTSALTIKNLTESPVTSVFIASQEDSDWGANTLSEPIPSEGEHTIEGIQKRVVKAKVVFEDEGILVTERIDLTEFENYVLTIEMEPANDE